MVVPGYYLGVGDGAAEDVEGAADGGVDSGAAEGVDAVEVVEGGDAAGVGGGDGGVAAEEFDEGVFNAHAFAFDIDAVDEVFGAVVGQGGEGGGADFDVGEGLPAVGDDEVAAVAFAATEVEYQTLGSDGGDHGGEVVGVDAAVAEDEGGDDDVAGSGVEVAGGVERGYAAAHLESAGVGSEGGESGGVVVGSEGDDVSAGEGVAAIDFGEFGGGAEGFEIDDGAACGVIGERAADNLDDASLAKIDARSEFHISWPFVAEASCSSEGR